MQQNSFKCLTAARGTVLRFIKESLKRHFSNTYYTYAPHAPSKLYIILTGIR